MNFREVKGPYGGANSFLRTLHGELRRRGVTVTNDARADVDVVFLNALTDDIDLPFVERIAARGAPVVHRKTGFRGRGVPEMRREVDGVVQGDRLQVEFTPFLAHTIFQSEYSRRVFEESGYSGPSTVIPNGVDESVFNTKLRRLGRGVRERPYWQPGSPVRVVISTWSKDENKGFVHYRQIDRILADRRNVTVELVGRTPTRFRNIRVHRPRAHARLAAFLKRRDVLLQLAEHETCSNALIEGINCGLPAIYLDSGANEEIARPYGIRYEGDFFAALDGVLDRYGEIVAAIPDNPYRIGLVAQKYLEVFESVLR